MALQTGHWLRTLAWLIVIPITIIAGGELILLIIEEAADLVLEATHAVFLLLFERGFGMPYAKAEGVAAWASGGLLVALCLLAVWKLIPWIKQRFAALRQSLGKMRAAAGQRWRSARWYQKGLVVLGGLTLLFVASMFI